MEEKKIGRPSTHASTLGTIQDRGYVSTRGQALVPSWLAFAVTRRSRNTSPSSSTTTSPPRWRRGSTRSPAATRTAEWLRRFYFGDEASSAEGLRELVEDLGDIDARGISTIEIGDGMVVRVGRYGPYVEEVVPPGVDPAPVR